MLCAGQSSRPPFPWPPAWGWRWPAEDEHVDDLDEAAELRRTRDPALTDLPTLGEDVLDSLLRAGVSEISVGLLHYQWSSYTIKSCVCLCVCHATWPDSYFLPTSALALIWIFKCCSRHRGGTRRRNGDSHFAVLVSYNRLTIGLMRCWLIFGLNLERRPFLISLVRVCCGNRT